MDMIIWTICGNDVSDVVGDIGDGGAIPLPPSSLLSSTLHSHPHHTTTVSGLPFSLASPYTTLD
jgi:hypothetical protein